MKKSKNKICKNLDICLQEKMRELCYDNITRPQCNSPVHWTSSKSAAMQVHYSDSRIVQAYGIAYGGQNQCRNSNHQPQKVVAGRLRQVQVWWLLFQEKNS